jgi:hypothetical protein
MLCRDSGPYLVPPIFQAILLAIPCFHLRLQKYCLMSSLMKQPHLTRGTKKQPYQGYMGEYITVLISKTVAHLESRLDNMLLAGWQRMAESNLLIHKNQPGGVIFSGHTFFFYRPSISASSAAIWCSSMVKVILSLAFSSRAAVTICIFSSLE